MVIGGINVLAVVVATVISMVLGFIWYSEGVFGKQWMASTGRTEVSGGAPAMYVLTAIFALLQATILAVIVTLAGATTLVAGATLGFLAWLGFVATTQGVDALFNARKMSFYAISTGYHLVEYVIIGALLGAWR
jgi:hypothetical protein